MISLQADRICCNWTTIFKFDFSNIIGAAQTAPSKGFSFIYFVGWLLYVHKKRICLLLSRVLSDPYPVYILLTDYDTADCSFCLVTFFVVLFFLFKNVKKHIL